MPLQYQGVVGEHLAVRSTAGLFDVSHLGKLTVEARDEESLDKLLPGKVEALSEFRAGYNLVLNEEGGIIDDIFVYRRPDQFILVPNAANTDVVIEALDLGGVKATDAREHWAILALQGPASREVMAALVAEANNLGLHRFADFEIEGLMIQIARTGYSGEYGFELFVPWDQAPTVWRRLLAVGEDHGVVPTGLGARDTLRLEMGFPLHGHEISAETNPIEAGLEWVIDWEKDFSGRTRLEEIKAAGVSRRLVGLLAHGREIPRAHHAVLKEDLRVGEVTSGNFSPVLRTGIALAYVASEYHAPGTMLSVDVRGKRLPVEVVKPPFVKG